jgi:predicted nucleic acid-binding protein
MSVVDASVFVAAVSQNELHHDQAVAWLDQILAETATLDVPAIVLSEVAAAISRGQNDDELANRALNLLLETDLIQIFPVTLELAKMAAEIGIKQRIRGCDAVYVALAEQLGTDLVSLDRQQVARGTAVVPTRQP